MLHTNLSFFGFALTSTGLMADQTGNYITSFYMTGGVVMFAFLIPFALIFINWEKSRVSPIVSREMKDKEAKFTAPRADVAANNFPAQS